VHTNWRICNINSVQFVSGSGLECYVCTDQEHNGDKCLNTIKTCEQDEDVCLSEIKWGSKLVCHNNQDYTSCGCHVTITMTDYSWYNFYYKSIVRKPCILVSYFVLYSEKIFKYNTNKWN